MNYIVKISTAAGDIFFGPYPSLEAAKAFSRGKYPIYGVFRADLTATDIQQMSAQELLKLLSCDTI